MKLKAYSISKNRNSLKLLCFRGGFSLNDLISTELLSGEAIIKKLEAEMGISNRELKISQNNVYTFSTLSLKKRNSFIQKIGDLFRSYIGGILLVKTI